MIFDLTIFNFSIHVPSLKCVMISDLWFLTLALLKKASFDFSIFAIHFVAFSVQKIVLFKIPTNWIKTAHLNIAQTYRKLDLYTPNPKAKHKNCFGNWYWQRASSRNVHEFYASLNIDTHTIYSIKFLHYWKLLDSIFDMNYRQFLALQSYIEKIRSPYYFHYTINNTIFQRFLSQKTFSGLMSFELKCGKFEFLQIF